MGGEEVRLFVGIYPPEASARAMLRALAKLDPAPDPRHRLVSLEQVHLTLQFVGQTRIKELPAVIESVQRSASGLGRFDLMPQRLVTFPERGPVRLIAMETDSPPTLLEIQKRLAHRLAHKVRRKPGGRFRPHLTLARFTGSARPARIDQPVLLEAFNVHEIVLMKSLLLPEGARHIEVERVELG